MSPSAIEMAMTQSSQHYSLDAEQTVIAAIIMDETVLIDVASILKPSDFYEPLHQAIYGAMLDLMHHKCPIDFVTVSEKLEDNKQLQELGGSAFLAQLMQTLPTSSHAIQYAEIVKDKSDRRRLGKTLSRLISQCGDMQQPASELIQDSVEALMGLAGDSVNSDWSHLADVCDTQYDHYSHVFESPENYTGVATGFFNLDSYLGGLLPGDLVVVAGRPGMGKTAFAMNIARNVAKKQKNIGVVSVEMGKEQITDRLVAGELGIETQALHGGKVSEDTFADLGRVMDDLRQLNVYFDDSTRTLTQLVSKARQLKLRHGLDLLIIDYLQLLQGPNNASENRVQEISALSRGIKQLARDLGCPVILLSQLNRAVEHRPSKVPQLADLRDSGSIEQDADVVLMMYREGYYDEHCERPTITDLFIRKHRQGKTGRVELDFDADRTHFISVDSSREFQDLSKTIDQEGD